MMFPPLTNDIAVVVSFYGLWSDQLNTMLLITLVERNQTVVSGLCTVQANMDIHFKNIDSQRDSTYQYCPRHHCIYFGLSAAETSAQFAGSQRSEPERFAFGDNVLLQTASVLL